MSFWDFIKNFITNNKKNARFITKTLVKTYGDPEPLEVGLYDDETPITGEEIGIEINGKQYIKSTDNDGIARLNINLIAGNYTAKLYWRGINGEYNSVTGYVDIIVEPQPEPVQPSGDKKTIVLGCDKNTEDDSTVQNRIAERLEQEGYPVEKLAIEPNAFASYDYSNNAKGKIGIYLIASGIFSIADAYYGNGQFDNYIFGIRGDFGDKGATCFDCPISADADCTSICDELDGKTFNQINSMLQPYVAICGGASTDELADNIIDWLRGLEHKEERPVEQEKSRSEKILDYFEEHFGRCEYIDEALEAIQGRGYSFYFSDGYNMYDTIDRVANGDGANCFDIAEVLYHCAKAMNTKYGRNYEVQYLDVWCPVSGYDHIRLRLKSNGSDWFYRDGACVLDGGDVTSNWCGTSDNILEVNPNWIYDGD